MVKSRKEKILLLGATGCLGSDIAYFLQQDFVVFGTHYSKEKKAGVYQLDLRDRKATEKLIDKIKPDIVLNIVGIADPDICEKNKKLAYEINYQAAQNLADVCRKKDLRFFYISTSAVFSEEQHNPNEHTVPDPVNYYGLTKLLGEIASHEGVVVRIPFVISRTARKDRILQELFKNRDTVFLDNARVRKFVWSKDVAIALKLLITKDVSRGIYHVATDGACTKYEFAQKFLDCVPMNKALQSKQAENVARRPKKESLSTAKIKKLGMRFTPFKKMFQDKEFYDANK